MSRLPPSLARQFGTPRGASTPLGTSAASAPITDAAPLPGTAHASKSSRAEEFAGTYHWEADQGREQAVYRTRERWSGLDVYLSQTQQQNVLTIFTVRVYAILPGGLRVLVETGRLGNLLPPGLVNFVPRLPVWIAAARSQATRYEVTVQVTGGAGANSGDVTVCVVASSGVNPPPEWVGTIRLDAAIDSTLDTQKMPDVMLVSLQAVATEGVTAPRYLQVFDADGAVTDSPAFVFPICGPGGAPAGNGKTTLNYRAATSRIRVVASTTADVFTPAGDCFMQGVAK